MEWDEWGGRVVDTECGWRRWAEWRYTGGCIFVEVDGVEWWWVGCWRDGDEGDDGGGDEVMRALSTAFIKFDMLRR